MQVGQAATIKIDAYPNKKWTGHVASLNPGTGSTFSLLPPENASGNWVKVTQRVPVKIALDTRPDNKLELASGLSATVTIDTSTVTS